MNRLEKILYLNQRLLAEMPEYRPQAAAFGQDDASQRRLLRSLMNLRPPRPLDPAFLAVQDALLADELAQKGVVDAAALPACPAHPRIALWQGDITRLAADAIVNAANSALLGCFCPCHGCIDNAIHSAAGLQLRDACDRLMQAQGCPEPPGRAKLTAGYALPARYVLHTVGPIVQGRVTPQHRAQLRACYHACLRLAAEHGLHSVAFCCLSTGEFHFPHQEAAEIAVAAVMDFLRRDGSGIKVIFDVFTPLDYHIYQGLLGAAAAATPGAE